MNICSAPLHTPDTVVRERPSDYDPAVSLRVLWGFSGDVVVSIVKDGLILGEVTFASGPSGGTMSRHTARAIKFHLLPAMEHDQTETPV